MKMVRSQGSEVRGKFEGALREFEVLLEQMGTYSSQSSEFESRECGTAGRTQGSPLRETPSWTVLFECQIIASRTVFLSLRLAMCGAKLEFGVRA
jgi:hypothetical protein